MKTEFADCSSPLIRLPIWGEQYAVLMEDWHVNEVCGFEFTVPAGTQTDGASIPRFLWRVCGHPLEVPRVYAAVLHDWLYAYGHEIGVSRATADGCYRAILRHFGVAAWRAYTEYAALRLFGGAHYNEGSEDE